MTDFTTEWAAFGPPGAGGEVAGPLALIVSSGASDSGLGALRR